MIVKSPFSVFVQSTRNAATTAANIAHAGRTNALPNKPRLNVQDGFEGKARISSFRYGGSQSETSTLSGAGADTLEIADGGFTRVSMNEAPMKISKALPEMTAMVQRVSWHIC